MVSEISLKFTVDRIEEGYAVLLLRDEESTTLNWPLETIPFSVSEGDILTFEIEKDEEEREAARERVKSLLQKLQEKDRNRRSGPSETQ